MESGELRHARIVDTLGGWLGRGFRRANAREIEEKWGERTRILCYGTVSERDDFLQIYRNIVTDFSSTPVAFFNC